MAVGVRSTASATYGARFGARVDSGRGGRGEFARRRSVQRGIRRSMRLFLPFLLLVASPASVMAATLEYTCKLERTFGPVSASSGAPVRVDDKTKDKGSDRFIYDAASEQAATSDAHGALSPALALKVGGGIKFIAQNVVTIISDSGEFHRVETVTVDGKLTTSIGVGRCTVKETRLAGKPFSDR
jgi:hypothetical protein